MHCELDDDYVQTKHEVHTYSVSYYEEHWIVTF